MRRAAVFKWRKRLRNGETNVKDEPRSGKVIFILFFDVKGIILQHWVPPGQNVSGKYYAAVFRRAFRNAIRGKKKPDFSGKKKVPHSRQCQTTYG
jgi:hypothetical protein